MWDWAVRALGVFWFAGGMVTLRALRLDRTLDGMFAGLGRGFGRHDVVRASLLALGAVLTVEFAHRLHKPLGVSDRGR